MSGDETLYGGMNLMHTSVTSESSTLSGLATGPIPGQNLTSGSATGGLVLDSDASYAVMNDKVQVLAGSIYEELERMITKYDQEVVKNLMPLIVNVLESLDLAYTETQELEVELELLKEDNEQLVTQYEREKQLRKGSDQKLLELEDIFEGERKESTIKIESLTSIVKMFELKSKNSQDHIVRLEDKENEMKKEYSKLHDRYTELFKTHIDYMERTKSILGTERLDQLQSGAGTLRPRIAGMALNQLNRSSGPVSFGYSELENNNQQASILTSADFAVQTTPGIDRTQTSLKTELMSPVFSGDPLPKRGGWMDTSTSDTQMVDLEVEEAEDLTGDPSFGPGTPTSPTASSKGIKSQTKTEKRTGNTLYQELSFQDSEALGDVDEGADITGMGKEVENLISENNELLATKNALNIVKDDLIAKLDELTGEHEILREEIRSLQEVRSRLQQRIHDLEEELKKVKEEAEAAKATRNEEDGDVPMAQRKRFTRVEMARVLMERNQYKEKFMELQEAVRWTEMIRAARHIDPVLTEKKNPKGIWKFFGNLFSGHDRLGDTMGPYVNMKFSGSSPEAAEAVTPALTTMRARSSADRKTRAITDVFDGDTLPSGSGGNGGANDKATSARRATERKEQYKQVRAHVKTDDGRMQAYGWSVPATATKSEDEVKQQKQHPVPVPVYCRPLMEKEPGMKIWCAAAVNMSGGRTKDGGDIVGASVFYHQPPQDETCGNVACGGSNEDPVSQLDDELTEGKRLVDEASHLEKEVSSHVWICTSTHSTSKVTVIDANSPSDVLESFHVCSSHLLCIASVPGAKESDYRVDDELNRLVLEESELRDADAAKKLNQSEEAALQETGLGAVSFVTCAVGSEPVSEEREDEKENQAPSKLPQSAEDTDAVHRRFVMKDGATPPKVKDGVSEVSRQNEIAFAEVEKMSSVLPTMWLGSQSGAIYVHSSVAQWKRCIHSIRLNDSVLSIVHVKGRVLAALANGTIAIFHRTPEGQWDLTNYHLLDLGRPNSSIRCMVQVHNNVWCGYKNKIYVVNPKMMRVEGTFDAHPRKESQVRLMAWTGDGVWVSIRLDSTLRLYHAHTHEHLQDVDIEPYVSKMLGTGKLGFSFVRITSMIVSCNRLWMGTGNGVIISVPLAGATEGGQIFSDKKGESLTAETFMPFCSMAQAQLSFHGHRDAVKFFVAVPGHGGLSMASSSATSSPTAPDVNDSMLIVSGGEGYIDFRIVDDGSDQDHDSHLMVWQLRNVLRDLDNRDLKTTVQGHKALASTDDKKSVGKTSSPFSLSSLKSLSPTYKRNSKPPSPKSPLSKSPSPFSALFPSTSRSRSSSMSSSAEASATSSTEHVSLAKEATELAAPYAARPDSLASDTNSYVRWNQNVESMLENSEPREDFTQLPSYGGSGHSDRGIN